MPAMVAEMSKSSAFDFIAADAEEDPPFGKEHFIQEVTGNVEGFVKVKKESDKPLLIVFDERSTGITEANSWNYQTRAQLRTLLVQEKIAFFPSTEEAARAVNEVIKYYQRREETAG